MTAVEWFLAAVGAVGIPALWWKAVRIGRGVRRARARDQIRMASRERGDKG